MTDETIDWEAFERVHLCAGTVVRAERFAEARKPAFKVWVDFGDYGIRGTSAQIASLYEPAALVGQQIVGVLNFPPKRIGPFLSEFLLTGFHTPDGVVITTVERHVPNGARMA